MGIKLDELARQIGARVHGDPTCEISGVASLSNAAPDSISFLSNRTFKKFLTETKAAAVIISPQDLSDSGYQGNALLTENVYAAYAKVAALLNPVLSHNPGIDSSAQIAQSAQINKSSTISAHVAIAENVTIGANCYIGPGCVLEQGVSIGDNTRLLANVVLCHQVSLGNGVIVHPGAVIGSDGFGIAIENGVWIKVPQLGSVRIADDVEIGANTTIDRGALEDTIIEQGVKLDNQIQVAHNVRIGAHTAIAGCVGIAGSAVIGRHCAIGGGSVILGHLEIVDNVQILGMSLVSKSISQPGQYSSGMPVQSSTEWNKNNARLRKLDDLARRVIELEKIIADLKSG